MFTKFVKSLQKKDIVVLPFDILDEILKGSEILEEKDTYFSDMIRILRIGKNIVVQEKSNKNEAVFRKIQTMDEAETFINSRLEVYENMWNGCGCKVNYYD